MKPVRKIKTFFRQSSTTKWLFIKSLFLSALVAFTLNFLSFKRIMRWLGQANEESPGIPEPATLLYRKQLATALRWCNQYSLWPTKCYTLSLTAKILLRRKRIPGTLYIGFYKDEKGQYKGHAWLRSADMIVTGNLPGINRYHIHSFFT